MGKTGNESSSRLSQSSVLHGPEEISSRALCNSLLIQHSFGYLHPHQLSIFGSAVHLHIKHEETSIQLKASAFRALA